MLLSFSNSIFFMLTLYKEVMNTNQINHSLHRKSDILQDIDLQVFYNRILQHITHTRARLEQYHCPVKITNIFNIWRLPLFFFACIVAVKSCLHKNSGPVVIFFRSCLNQKHNTI